MSQPQTPTIWTPHPTQLTTLQYMSRYREVTGVTGRQWGKTDVQVSFLSRAAYENPGDYLYTAEYRSDAKNIAWERFKSFHHLHGIPVDKNEQELTITNNRGGKIRLFQASDVDRVRGLVLKGVCSDEVQEYPANFFQTLRPCLLKHRGFSHKFGTPKGKIGQLYECFIRDPEYHDKEYRTYEGFTIDSDADCKSIIYPTSENPYISADEIEKARSLYTPEFFRQEYEASFENYTGLIYKEYLDNEHELTLEADMIDGKVRSVNKSGKKLLVQPYWNYYLGIDTGRHTAAILIAEDEYNNLYIIGEVYNIDGLVKDIADDIRAMIKDKIIKGKVIDSASQVKREYQAEGIACIDSEKDIQGSIQLERSAFKAKRLHITRNCIYTIKELKSRKWSDKRESASKKAEPVKENDHCLNAIDYIFNLFLKTKNEVRTPIKVNYHRSLAYLSLGYYKQKERQAMNYG